MYKIAILVLADTSTHENLGRIVNALEVAKEAKESGDDVKIIFDGGGTTWIPKLIDSDSQLHPLYEAVKDKIEGACYFCAKAFDVFKVIKESEIELLKEYDDHPSIRNLYTNGYKIITF